MDFTMMGGTFVHHTVHPSIVRHLSKTFVVTTPTVRTYIIWGMRRIPSQSKKYRRDMLQVDVMLWHGNNKLWLSRRHYWVVLGRKKWVGVDHRGRGRMRQIQYFLPRHMMSHCPKSLFLNVDNL